MESGSSDTHGGLEGRVRGSGRGRARGRQPGRIGGRGGTHSTLDRDGCPKTTFALEENRLVTFQFVSSSEDEEETVKFEEKV